ncbi:transient receptor potential cation channel subfamily M member 1-like isoform X1 [Mytilus californianus]|uniref:transient receptor potential cation channel subfamily M member 1-like isoform X1 n=2 Tax=Mytilus californianus TaxID=6549 RepID=UPI002245B7DD|nr:transient receptor potential cation channel subfamily M member 1-like isoform X1 [Mytilus californianus]XP_052079707.1 transient receptor potential cation channel subfamily M member 1-like isoform X1 [Mytilus californianus]
MTSVAARSTFYGAETPPSGRIWENGSMNEYREDVTKKREKKRKEKSGYSLQNKSMCPLCIRLLKVKKDQHKLKNGKEPVAVLSIIGEAKEYLPNETIKNQLKTGLIELMITTCIWIITEGRDTCIGQVVEEVIRGNTDKCQSRCFHKDDTERDRLKTGNQSIQPNESNLEVFIKEHLKIPLIVMLVGGGENSFEAALGNLKRSYPVLVIEGSGKAADFICKGYRMGMHNNSEELKSEMIEAAKMVYGSNNEKADTIQTKCEKLITHLQDVMERNSKSIHVYSVHETTYTLDRTIQDILFQLICKDETNEDKLTDNILHFVDLWNRPDIAEKEIFKLENSKVLENLQKELGKKKSKLSELFINALKKDRIDLVRQVLEYNLDKKLYKSFLDHSLEGLYETDGCIGGSIFTKLKEKTSKQNNIVEMINDAVIKILGSEEMKPFQKGDEIGIDDIFKHLFVWAVLMNRRDLAMLFWKKDGDFICSALYASSLAKRLAENASAEAFMDQQTALLESSRHYEDLAYSVMTELYFNDRKHARQLLVTKVKRYNSTTIFEITEKFTLMKFMGHAACQTKLNKIWKGGITGDTSNLKAIVFAVTVLPILKWDIVKSNKTGERSNNKFIQSVRSDTKEQEKNTTWLQSAPNWMRKIYYFYNSPLIKFLFSVLMYMTMLAVFSLFVLTDLHPMEEKFPSVYEYIVYVWAASTLAEEIRQAYAMKHFKAFELKQLSLNAMTWFSFWTLFEMLMYLMFITSVFLRLTLSAEKFYYARMMYAVTLGTFIINSMQFFLVSKHIGPKVIMIGRMMFDVIFFILIFAVFLFGFGVIYQATMYPNESPGLPLFQNLIYMPYWQLYGELFLEQFDGTKLDHCTDDVALYSNGTMERCPLRNQINTFVLAVYMVVTHIILVNILIAMFSHTFTKVQDNNELVWKFHRFSLIEEYYDRSFFVPPFTIINHILMAILYIKNGCTDKRKNKFKTDAENEILAILERDAVYSHFNSSTRLRRHRAKNMDAEKDGFDASYEKDTDLSLQEQINVLSADVDIIQKNQEETLKAVKQLIATKQNILIVEVPRGIRSENMNQSK